MKEEHPLVGKEPQLIIEGLNRQQQVALLRVIPEDKLEFFTPQPKLGEFGDPSVILAMVTLSAVAITALVAWLRSESSDLKVKFNVKVLGIEAGFEVAASDNDRNKKEKVEKPQKAKVKARRSTTAMKRSHKTDAATQFVKSDVLAFFQEMKANAGDILPARVFLIERMAHYKPNEKGAFSVAVNELLLDGIVEVQMGEIVLTKKGWYQISRS